jgi:hypothetical protein
LAFDDAEELLNPGGVQHPGSRGSGPGDRET